MRRAFVTTLVRIARADPRIVLITGDLGYMALEPFAEAFPERFFNVGVAEQNMVGLATGMAEAGLVPFVYSIVPFAVLRPYEFIRNGPILHRLAVRIVGVGGGFEYGTNGLTHFGIEDIGVMRIQPGLTVVCPADGRQAESAVERTWQLPGPIYYRLGKDDRLIVPGLDGRFEVDRVQTLGAGKDLLIVTVGSVATEAVRAVEFLAQQGVASTVAIVASFTPAACDHLAEVLSAYTCVLTVEAHYVNGGVGSLVCELVATRGLGCRVTRCGVEGRTGTRCGSQRYLLDLYGLSAEAIAERALTVLRPPPAPAALLAGKS